MKYSQKRYSRYAPITCALSVKHHPPAGSKGVSINVCSLLREDGGCSQLEFTAVGWIDSNSDNTSCQKKVLKCPETNHKPLLQR